MTDLICVGVIAGAFGVKGEVRVKSFCATPEDLQTYAPLTTEDGSQTFTVAIIGRIKNGFSARVTGIENKEQADAYSGTQLYASRDQLPQLPDDEYYYAELVGLEVLDTGGEALGTVKAVQNHGADDLLEVSIYGTSDTAFVPFTHAIVPTVDLTSGRIVIDPPEGLL